MSDNVALPSTGSRLPIWPGLAPGSESWTWSEQEMTTEGDRSVRNVVTPTLEVFAPQGRPNGTAVIVAPGGAYSFLMIDLEGTVLARELAARGATAFVLRYRVRHTPDDDVEMQAFSEELGRRTQGVPWEAGRRAIIGEEADHAARLGMQDGRQAVRYVRSHAPAWGIDPHRIGMVGFSAGAGLTMAAATAPDPLERPNFGAPIYSPQADVMEVPPQAPPLFLACATDDPAVPATESVKIWNAWWAAGSPAELHVFATGGHGFGTRKLGLPTDAWMELFMTWTASLGMLDPEATP